MDAINKRNFITARIIVLCVGLLVVPACSAQQDLHAQSATAVLARDFSNPDLSYLLLDENGQVIAQRWEHPDIEVPIGSLVKPFIAVAYGETHPSFLAFRCTGGKTCWLRRGHGTLRVREAIAFSCNSYFHQLIAEAGPDFGAVLRKYPMRFASNGNAEGWAKPHLLAEAYLELTRNSQDAAVVPVLQGMMLSAKRGTGRAAGAALLPISAMAKTGTAPCTHAKKAPGDGFALVMSPADHPRAILLLRLHGRPGSMAAEIAGRMIAAVEGKKAVK